VEKARAASALETRDPHRTPAATGITVSRVRRNDCMYYVFSLEKITKKYRVVNGGGLALIIQRFFFFESPPFGWFFYLWDRNKKMIAAAREANRINSKKNRFHPTCSTAFI
jgi:hypothetical protein